MEVQVDESLRGKGSDTVLIKGDKKKKISPHKKGKDFRKGFQHRFITTNRFNCTLNGTKTTVTFFREAVRLFSIIYTSLPD